MRCALLFAVFASVCLSGSGAFASQGCDGFTRQDALHCIEEYVDIDPKDGQISVHELEVARSKYLSGWQKAASWVASWFTDDYSNEMILHNCDANGDGIFTPSDFEQATQHCLPDERSVCMMKGICDTAAAEKSK